MNPIYVVVIAFLSGAACWGLAKRSHKLQVSEFNGRLQSDLRKKEDELSEELKRINKYKAGVDRWASDEHRDLDFQIAALAKREAGFQELRKSFEKGFLHGRKWLANLIVEAEQARDEKLIKYLKYKDHPAEKAAEVVAAVSAARRELRRENISYKYQLASLKEYFPFLEEYEEVILDERIPLANADDPEGALAASDPVHKYLGNEEYDRLSSAQRNQLALDRYLKNMSDAGIGRLFELFLGYKYEEDGWDVEYHGIVKGYDDLGRDLICRKNHEIKVIQAKCWSKEKVIREKHIFQLFGTKCLLELERPESTLFKPKVEAVITTTTRLSPVALKAADYLGIKHEELVQMRKQFPMIKCNINQQTGERIYHLPFDQQYDRTKITKSRGECYVSTTAEAEKLNFRRAYQYRGPY